MAKVVAKVNQGVRGVVVGTTTAIHGRLDAVRNVRALAVRGAHAGLAEILTHDLHRLAAEVVVTTNEAAMAPEAVTVDGSIPATATPEIQDHLGAHHHATETDHLPPMGGPDEVIVVMSYATRCSWL